MADKRLHLRSVSVLLIRSLSVVRRLLATSFSGACISVRPILVNNPLHYRPRAPALDINSESVGACHSVINRHFLWSGEARKQACNRKIGSTEVFANKIETAVA
jgi:hypothetical protein